LARTNKLNRVDNLTMTRVLALNRKSRSYGQLSEAVYGTWKGKLRLPPGMSVRKNTPAEFVVRVDPGSFVLEENALAIPPLPTFKFVQPFLIPTQFVFELELRRTQHDFDIVAICSSTRTVSLEEAKRLNSKRILPSGNYTAAALGMTSGGRVQIVQGGLPSLGKRR